MSQPDRDCLRDGDQVLPSTVILMSIVAAVGLVLAFLAHDDVLTAHKRGERATAMSALEASPGGGGS